jgi:putative ABC transport system permease protein
VGRTVLVIRVVARDLRKHLAEALLLVVAIAAATATLTMALALDGVTNKPYEQTRAATKGPDLVAYGTSSSQIDHYMHAKGVTAHSGPYPIASAVINADGHTAGVLAEGRTRGVVAVDQPKVLSGTWVRGDGVVLERTFAQALGVSVGARVTLNGQVFTVAGIAVTAAQAPYPNLCYFTTNTCAFFQNSGSRNVGLAWVTEPDALGLSTKSNPIADFALNLKLADPADADAFAMAHTSLPTRGPRFSGPGGPGPGAVFSTWDGIATADGLLVQDAQSVLAPGSILLALLAIASVAVLVGRRLSEYARRVGLLKAVGGTPAMIAVTFLSENLFLALVAGGIGLVVGRLATPLLTNPGAALIGSPGSPSLTVVNVFEVVGVSMVVALGSALVPAIRAARTSTVSALAEVARPPRRRAALIRLSRRLPVPAMFAVRTVARRPRRALLSTANMAVTVAGLVAVISFHASADSKLSGAATTGLTGTGLSDPVVNRDLQMLGVVTIMLVTLAVLNAVFTTWATVVDSRRSSALMRALGARSR